MVRLDVKYGDEHGPVEVAGRPAGGYPASRSQIASEPGAAHPGRTPSCSCGASPPASQVPQACVPVAGTACHAPAWPPPQVSRSWSRATWVPRPGDRRQGRRSASFMLPRRRRERLSRHTSTIDWLRYSIPSRSFAPPIRERWGNEVRYPAGSRRMRYTRHQTAPG